MTADCRQWALTAYADNVADERSWYPVPGDDLQESQPGSLGAPREVGLKLVYQLR